MTYNVFSGTLNHTHFTSLHLIKAVCVWCRTVVQRSASCASSSSPPGPITALPSTLRSCCSSFVAWSSWRHRTPDQWSFTAGNRYVNILTANYCNARLNWTSKLHFLYFTFRHCRDRVVNWCQFTMRSHQSWNVKYRKCNFVNWYQLGILPRIV